VAEVRSRRSFWSPFDRDGDTLRFHHDGVVIVRGPSTERVRWESVVEIRTSALHRDLERYVVRTTDNQTHVIELKRPDSAISRAQLHDPTLGRLLGDARAALASGSARFGPIVVDGAGIRTDLADLRWHRIADIRPQQLGRRESVLVILGRDHTWIELPLHDVPNVHVLIALFRELRAADPYASTETTDAAYAALKRLAEAQQRAPDAMTIGPRTYAPRRSGPLDSSQ